MSNIQAVNETFNIGLASTTLGYVTGLISFITGLYAFFKLVYKHLNSLPKHQKRLYKKSGIKTWKIKLLLIKIPLTKTPEITKWDWAFSVIILCIALIGMSFSGHIFSKAYSIPQNWAALTLSLSKEDFLLTYDKATSFDKHHGWMIDRDKCSNNSINNISDENKISQNLTELICQRVGKKDKYDEIGKDIKSTENDKKILYIILFIFSLQMLWLTANTCATLLYKKRLQKTILSEQERALKYLT